jgi:oligoribonuclease
VNTENLNLIWLDLETTGLDPQEDSILEIYATTTAGDLKSGRELCDRVLFFPRVGARRSHSVVQEMHEKGGLWDECNRSIWTVARAEREITDQLDPGKRYILAGNSVHFDLAFVRVLMPQFAKLLSHRVFDVAAIRMFCEALGMPPIPKGEPAHRARADVYESIATALACEQWARDAARCEQRLFGVTS